MSLFRIQQRLNCQEEICVIRNTITLLKNNQHKRKLFNGFAPKKKEYLGRKLVGFSCEQMYNVVSDVRNYKHFLPFCHKSIILNQKEGSLRAYLEIGFPPLLENYTSNVILNPHVSVISKCSEGDLFRSLNSKWQFTNGLKSNPQSCIIDFFIEFEFKSALHSHVAHIFFEKMVKQMEGAFIMEAKRRYGRESLPSHTLVATKS